MTDLDRLSKPSTVFLSLPAGAGAAALATDVGQYRDALTNATSYAHESPSIRAALTYPRAVSLVVDLNRDDEGTLVDHGDGAGSSSFRIHCAGSGLIQCYEDASVRISGTLPGIDGVTRRYLIHWASRLEGSGAKTELLLVNLGSGAILFAAASHAAGSTSEAYNLAINANGAGGADDIPIDRYRTVRIDRRFVTCVEAREDFIAERTPPTVSQVRRVGALVPDSSGLDIASDGSLAGPAHLWSGYTFRENDRRLVGPLVNLRVRNPLELTNIYAPAKWYRLAPGSSVLHMPISLLWYRPVPGKVNRAHVRIFVWQGIEVGDTCPVEYRMYSMAGLPLAGEDAAPFFYRHTAIASLDTNHGSGDGEWLDLGALDLVTDDWGMTWLGLSISFDGDSGSSLANDTTAQVHAVTVEPYAETGGGGGLDIAYP